MEEWEERYHKEGEQTRKGFSKRKHESVELDLSPIIDQFMSEHPPINKDNVLRTRRIQVLPQPHTVVEPKKMKIYAGIGSRETPEDVLEWMESIGEQLGQQGWILRSGFADGADNAFARGAEKVNGFMEIFIPWAGFNGAPSNDYRIINFSTAPAEIQQEAWKIAAAFHPNWGACSEGARALHARNVPQVVGIDLNTKADCIICWTPGGKGGGGTGQAIRIARHLGIPVFDLFNIADRIELCAFTKQ
jgi:hypothetical protein